MKILVVNIAACVGGSIEILKSFYDYIKNNDKINEYVFFLSEPYLPETKNIKIRLFPKVKASRLNKLLFDFVYGKKIIKKYNPDVVFSLQNTAVWGLKIPQALYIQQAIPFQSVKKFSFFKKEEREAATYQYLIGYIIKKSAQRAERVIVQSEFMKEAVSKAVGKPKSLIYKIAPPLSFNPEEYKNEPCSSSSFFYPTSAKIHKNVSCLYEALNLLKLKHLPKFKIKLTLNGQDTENIEYLGYISHENVLKELSGSTLVFTSYIESHPLPLLEAKALGTIILASDCPFSKEILGSYKNAYFFNPFKPQELAALMADVAAQKIKRLDTSSIAHMQTNSWGEVVAVLKELAKAGK